MKNPETKKPQNCPAVVYGNHDCTVRVKTGAPVGWMVWGRHVVAVVLSNGIYVPFNLADKLADNVL